MGTFKTPKKGTVLPLMNLKGKDYLQVAHRMQWFVEENDRFEIITSFPTLSADETVCHAKVTVYGREGNIKAATATKRERRQDFSDHTEKAETGAIGRALALLGYGTQFALADLDEGDRIVDSPQTNSASHSPQPMNSVSRRPNEAAPNDPLSYRVPFGKKYKDKTLREIGAADAIKFANWLKSEAAKSGKALTRDAQELVLKVSEAFHVETPSFAEHDNEIPF